MLAFGFERPIAQKAAQHGINEVGYSAMSVAFRNIDELEDRRVDVGSRIDQLVHRQAAKLRVSTGGSVALRSPMNGCEIPVERAAHLDRPVRKFGCKCAIARVEIRLSRAIVERFLCAAFEALGERRERRRARFVTRRRATWWMEVRSSRSGRRDASAGVVRLAAHSPAVRSDEFVDDDAAVITDVSAHHLYRFSVDCGARRGLRRKGAHRVDDALRRPGPIDREIVF